MILELQVNFCISNTDMSNTMQVSKWDDGPGRFNYIYDLRKPRYLEHINLEYLAYLEVDWRFQELKHTHYLEVHEISRSTEFTPMVHRHPVVLILRSIEQFQQVSHGLYVTIAS